MKPIDRMFAEMEAQGISIKEMSEMLGFDETSRISNWKRRKSIPKEALADISEILGIWTSWLLIGEGDRYTDKLAADAISKIRHGNLESIDDSRSTKGSLPQHLVLKRLSRQIKNEHKKLVPIYENIEASAGDGTTIEEEIATDHMLVETEWLQSIVHHVPKDMAIIKVKGDSMTPTLSPGDMILVNRKPVERNQLNDGVYVINRNGSTHVKRLQNVEGGIRIISDNKEFYEPEIVTDGLIVCGRVIWAWQGKRF